MIEFIQTWLLFFGLVLLTMTHDNFWWISSSPEWLQVKKLNSYGFIRYVWNDRVIPVWTNYRDIIPAALSSLCLTLAWYSYFLTSFLVLMIGMIATLIFIKRGYKI